MAAFQNSHIIFQIYGLLQTLSAGSISAHTKVFQIANINQAVQGKTRENQNNSTEMKGKVFSAFYLKAEFNKLLYQNIV